MVLQFEAGAAGVRWAQHQGCDGEVADLAASAATLVAALEQALLAARHLLGALDTCPCRHSEADVSPVLGTGSTDYGAPVTTPAASSQGSKGCVPRAAAPAQGGHAELSHREVEVLRLLAAGQSNRQIAAALFLSPRTVQRHVANVYPKIGAHCRAEAIAFALRHGLA